MSRQYMYGRKQNADPEIFGCFLLEGFLPSFFQIILCLAFPPKWLFLGKKKIYGRNWDKTLTSNK